MDLDHLVVWLHFQIGLVLQPVNGVGLIDCPREYPYMFEGKCVKECPLEGQHSHESCILQGNVEHINTKVHKRDTWQYCESNSVHCISPMICQEGRCVCPYYTLFINGSCRNKTTCPSYIPYIEITSQGRQCTDRCHGKDVLYKETGLCLPICDEMIDPPQTETDVNNSTVCSTQCPMYYFKHCTIRMDPCSSEYAQCVSLLPIILAFVLCFIAVVVLSVTLWFVAFNGRRNIHQFCQACFIIERKRKKVVCYEEDQEALIDKVI